jgi:large subunit ribosomal protein L18
MKSHTTTKQFKRKLRHGRVRAIVSGTAKRPRLSIFRSLNHIYAQLIDDTAGKTLASSNSKLLKVTGAKIQSAETLGKDIATKAKGLGIEQVVFDRGGNKYHGRVKAVAESARAAGLIF